MANQEIVEKPVIEYVSGADQSLSAPLAPQGQWNGVQNAVNRYGEIERIGGKLVTETFSAGIIAIATAPDGGLFVETRDFITGDASLFKIASMQNG